MQRLVWGHKENLKSIDGLSCHGGGCMQSEKPHSVLINATGLKQNSSEFFKKWGGKETKRTEEQQREAIGQGCECYGAGGGGRETEWELDKETSVPSIHPAHGRGLREE